MFAGINTAGPLSPSHWLNFDTAAIDSGSSTNSNGLSDDGNSIDFFRMYLDMQNQQQKEYVAPQQSNITPPTSTGATVSMADIEQWQSLLASSSMNGLGSARQNDDNSSLFPFAEARNATPPSSTTSFPPSAFSPTSISTGSDVPIDPSTLFGSIFGQMPSAFIANSAPSQSIQPKVEPVDAVVSPVAARAPVTQSTSRKRGVSELAIPPIPEEEEHDGMSDDDSQSDDSQDDDDIDEDVGRGRRGGQKASKARKVTKSTTGKKKGSNKKSNAASVAAAQDVQSTNQGIVHPHALVPVPDWSDRPSKADYDKLSSKEKRQLRNKISARNFRHRRKAHIDTLEEQLGEKNQVIDVLREEVGTLRSENQGLRADIEVLKKNWESIAAKITASTVAAPTLAPTASTSTHHSLSPEEDDLYGSASLPALSPPSSTASTNGDNDSIFESSSVSTLTAPSTSSNSTKRATRSSASSSIIRPNTRKDLSGNGNAFWGTNTGTGGWFGGGRSMDVHTTFVPELSLSPFASPPPFINSNSAALLAEKPRLNKDSLGAYFANMQSNQSQPQPSPFNQFAYGQNMNPALNGLSQDQMERLRETLNAASGMDGLVPSSSKSNSKASSPSSSPASSAATLASSGASDHIRDGFFESNPVLSLRPEKLQSYRGQLYGKLAHNFAGIAAVQSANRNGRAPPEGLRPAFFSNNNTGDKAVQAEAELARLQAASHTSDMRTAGALVTQTLLTKLSTAFWDAFAGENPSQQHGILSNKSSSRQSVDHQKVADVIGGKSRLAVVPNKDGDALDDMTARLGGLQLQKKQ